jgi:hypothetical protein
MPAPVAAPSLVRVQAPLLVKVQVPTLPAPEPETAPETAPATRWSHAAAARASRDFQVGPSCGLALLRVLRRFLLPRAPPTPAPPASPASRPSQRTGGVLALVMGHRPLAVDASLLQEVPSPTTLLALWSAQVRSVALLCAVPGPAQVRLEQKAAAGTTFSFCFGVWCSAMIFGGNISLLLCQARSRNVSNHGEMFSIRDMVRHFFLLA